MLEKMFDNLLLFIHFVQCEIKIFIDEKFCYVVSSMVFSYLSDEWINIFVQNLNTIFEIYRIHHYVTLHQETLISSFFLHQ